MPKEDKTPFDVQTLVARHASFSPTQIENITRYEDCLRQRMAEPVQAKRLAHSLSVARCAENLALVYGVDPYEARVAGILHDWDKVLGKRALIQAAESNYINLGVDIELVVPLLHGLTAECELVETFPELTDSILQAVARHTIGAVDMSDLDMVVFVADSIEPLRKGSRTLTFTRKMVGEASLEDLFWETFTKGIQYVIETERYLYPGTLHIYNELALQRKEDSKTIKK